MYVEKIKNNEKKVFTHDLSQLAVCSSFQSNRASNGNNNHSAPCNKAHR